LCGSSSILPAKRLKSAALNVSKRRTPLLKHGRDNIRVMHLPAGTVMGTEQG